MLVRPKKYFFAPLLPFIFLFACTHLKVQRTETQHTVISQPQIDSATYKFILPYKQSLDVKMNEVIGVAPVALVKSLPESNLGNFFADAMMQKALSIQNTDTANLVALFNTGGLRTSVPQGDVHVGNMFELMPFENELVLVPLKGSELLLVLNAIAEKGGAPLAGVRFVITNKKAEKVFVHQSSLDTAKVYTIATSDYLANGGDKFFAIESPKTYAKTKILLRDILIEYCKNLYKQNKPVTGVTDGRISIAK
jgi:2',3'-cyclic-nucleotide 2'-phosphodiesterase (5'-nucleotidase family)